MRSYYLLANGQPDDRAIYYTGEEAFQGGELWGNINNAYKFNSLKDICDFISKRNDTCASPIIVEIAEITYTKCIQGYKDWLNHIESDNNILMCNFNTVSYITNSRK